MCRSFFLSLLSVSLFACFSWAQQDDALEPLVLKGRTDGRARRLNDYVVQKMS